jgi:DNA-binding transcriptional ArsR family regulator
MHDQCFTHFIEFLSTTAEHIRTGEITPEKVISYRQKIDELQSRRTFPGCTACIGDMAALFDKQLDLMRSLGILRQEKTNARTVTDIPEEVVVREIFEPIGNVQRFQMLKSLGTGTRSFSDLSRLTGLKAGNLLFHIRKLTESGMILQRRERGDYIITDRGYRTLLGVAALYETLL